MLRSEGKYKVRDRERESYRKGEIEDELEGELAELFEEDIAEHYEARTYEGKTGCSDVDRRQDTAIVCHQIPGGLYRRRHFYVCVNPSDNAVFVSLGGPNDWPLPSVSDRAAHTERKHKILQPNAQGSYWEGGATRLYFAIELYKFSAL